MLEYFYRSLEVGFVLMKFIDDLLIFVVYKSFYIVLCDNYNVFNFL